MAVAPASLTPLQPCENLVVNAMDCGGEVFVGELVSFTPAVADDDVAIGKQVGIGHHSPQ
jgi:hypothetical protein